MRITLLLSILLFLSMGFKTINTALGGGYEYDPSSLNTNDLIIHEWGTFTYVMNSTGTILEGLRHDDWDLPPFVYNNAKGFKYPVSYNDPSFKYHSKMETPVIYFYAKNKNVISLSVKVDFPNGKITHWYPKALDVKLEKNIGTINWGNICILPRSEETQIKDQFAYVPDENHYLPARDVDSNPVRIYTSEKVGENVYSRGPWQYEKFLFYRGLGTIKFPLTSKYTDGKLMIKNESDEEIQNLIMVDVKDGKARFIHLPITVAPQSERAILDEEHKCSHFTNNMEQIKGELVTILIQKGLYEKEARAMIN
ncbi:MAG: hypothetical protein HY606_10155, partial [Planctomycetes bacterium]|nr:hypothetical protein [Planctomycetota bacterium]